MSIIPQKTSVFFKKEISRGDLLGHPLGKGFSTTALLTFGPNNYLFGRVGVREKWSPCVL